MSPTDFIYDALGPDLASDFVLTVRDTVNQATKFTYRQQFVQRVLAIASSTTSIVACLCSFYLYFAIDPRRLVFRHHLIFFLLFYDLLKAVILLLYPTRVLTHNTSYYSNGFCQVVGFFTATAIEGADFAILCFAVHTFLLIFKPQLTVRLENGRNEGGLYIYRNYIYVLSVVIPLVLASLAYVKGTGYSSYVCWCSLPQQPIWYRLVLSWVPRYLIVVTIITVYCMIYFHVIREFKTLGGVFKTIHNAQNRKAQNEKPTFFSALKYSLRALKNNVLPSFALPNQEELKRQSMSSTTKREAEETPSTGTSDEELGVAMSPIYGENLESFRKRQKVIEKQMKSIFIYPIAYILIWLFPFILYITQIKYEQDHPPIYWLNCMGAFMQPLNGFVDSLVFFYRELPWEYTVMRNFEKEHGGRIAEALHHRGTIMGSESIATSAKLTKQSISLSMAVNIKEYPKWRQWLHYLKLPLYELPSEENINKYQTKLFNDIHLATKEDGLTPHSFGESHAESPGGVGAGLDTHDFSNILAGGDVTDFRSNLEDFSLNFSSQKRTSFVSGQSKRVSVSNKSTRSRQMSVIDPQLSRLYEGHLSANNANTSNAFPDNTHYKGTGLVAGTPRRSTQVVPGLDNSSSNGDDMDFLEFLNKGPN